MRTLLKRTAVVLHFRPLRKAVAALRWRRQPLLVHVDDSGMIINVGPAEGYATRRDLRAWRNR